MQEDFPGVKPFQIDTSQQSVEEAGDYNYNGKESAKAAEQLIRFVLLCQRPNVKDKNSVSLPHFGD